jgi:uncharacterized membrane protein YtjA (UPF0391 family)
MRKLAVTLLVVAATVGVISFSGMAGEASALLRVAFYIVAVLFVLNLVMALLGWTPFRTQGVAKEDEDATLNDRGLPTDRT